MEEAFSHDFPGRVEGRFDVTRENFVHHLYLMPVEGCSCWRAG